MENTHELQTALIYFIQSKPEGNALRDIAIRTLKDLNWKTDRSFYGSEDSRFERVTKIQKEAIKAKEFEEFTRQEINVYARKNLIKLRKQTYLGQERFAKVINLNYEKYRHYERGRIILPIEVVVNVCSAFNLPIEKFLTQSI